LVLAVLALWGFAFGTLAAAEKRYGPGAADAEIKIGQTMPYSCAASAYGTIGKAEAAYFAMINDQGGINGRKIKFLIPR
jgi:branched-chain amino acid transport system substrate-binding protein